MSINEKAMNFINQVKKLDPQLAELIYKDNDNPAYMTIDDTMEMITRLNKIGLKETYKLINANNKERDKKFKKAEKEEKQKREEEIIQTLMLRGKLYLEYVEKYENYTMTNEEMRLFLKARDREYAIFNQTVKAVQNKVEVVTAEKGYYVKANNINKFCKTKKEMNAIINQYK